MYSTYLQSTISCRLLFKTAMLLSDPSPLGTVIQSEFIKSIWKSGIEYMVEVVLEGYVGRECIKDDWKSTTSCFICQ